MHNFRYISASRVHDICHLVLSNITGMVDIRKCMPVITMDSHVQKWDCCSEQL